MAAFNLTAELNIRGPSNLGRVVADIRRQLSSVSLDVTINPNTSRGIQAVTSDVRSLSTALREAQTNAVALGTALRGIGGSFNNLSSGVNNIGNSLGRVSTQSSAVSGSIRAASSEMAEFGKQSALAIRRFAAFSVATGAVYALSKAVMSAYSEFVNFNKEFVRLQQVTDTTKSGLSGLSSEITRLSTSLGVSSSELLTVSVTLAQAGLSAGETKQALEALAKSALAPSFDNLNDTVEGSIALMRQFGIGAGGLESALGSVNAVAAKFAVEAGDIISAIQRTGGVFANASRGVSQGKDALNEFLAVFTSVRATTRESAETIATGLRTIFTRIQRTSTIDALKDFGITLTDLEGKFVGPFEAVRRLSEGLKTLDPRDLRFSKIVEELGGFRQIGKVIPLIQQFTVAQQALSVAQKGSGSLAADAATAQESLAVRITKVREQFIALVRDIGQSSSFQAFADVSLKIASALISVADAAKDVAPAIAAIAAIRGVGALGQFFGGFSGGVSRRPRGFATGGYVPGSGNGDTVPAMLTPGEFVVRKKAVQSIGSQNLHRMNKYNGGGRVKKFGRGGLANAPMVDDILQTTGSILPRPSAVEELIKAGGGAVDLDRAVKRTIGDKAYSKAPSLTSKKNVLTRYFENDQNRLQDIQSAPLTGFGKSLQEAIKKGQLKGSNISLISKSRRTKGVPEYLSNLLGIPIQNMIFTQGADKQPAVDAMRSKGPRINRVSRFNLGGLVQRFAQKAGGSFRSGSVKSLSPQEQLELRDLLNLEKRFGESGDTLRAFTKDKQSRLSQLKSRKELVGEQSNEKVNGIKLSKQFGVSFLEGGAADISANINDVLSRGNATGADKLRAFIGDKQKSRGAKITTDGVSSTLSTGAKDIFDRQIVNGLPPLFDNAVADLPEPLNPGKGQVSTNQLISSSAQQAIKGYFFEAFVRRASQNLLSDNDKTDPIFDFTGAGNKGALNRLFGGRFVTPNEFKVSPTSENIANAISKAIAISPASALQYFNSGGSVQDTVPALLTPGEFVIKKSAASKLGASRLSSLNKADKIQGFNKGGFVQRFAGGGSVLPARPDDPTRLNSASSSTAITAINEMARALEALGVSASASARLVEAGGAISIRTSERALQTDINRLRMAGASATDIYRAEQQLGRVRQDNANKLNSQQFMGGASGATLQNIQTGAEEERQRLLNQRRTTMAARGRSAAEIEETLANDTGYQDHVRRRSYETATSRATGAPASAMRDAGVTGTDIEQYINQSTMDRRTLAQMDVQLIRTREHELRNSAAFSTASRSEQNRMLRELRARNNEEISTRRQIVTDLARDRGFAGGSGRVTRGLQTTGALFGMGSFRETEAPGGGLGGRLNRFSAGAQRAGFGLSIAGGMIGDTIGNAVGGQTGKGIGAASGAFASSVGVGAMFGPMGALIGVVVGATSAIKAWKDAVADATLAEEQEKTEKATLKVEKAFERLEKSTNKTESRSAIKDIGDNLGTIVKSFNVSANAKTDRMAVTPGVEKFTDLADLSRVGNSIADASYGVANIVNELGSKAANFIGARFGVNEDKPLNFNGFRRETDRSTVEKEIGGLARASEVNKALPRLVEQSLRKGQTMADLETELGRGNRETGARDLSSMKEIFAIAQGDVVASGLATNIAISKDKLKDTTDPAERAKIKEQIDVDQKALRSRGNAVFDNDIKKNIIDKIAAENKAAAAAAAATIKINLFSEVLNDIGAAASKAGVQFESAQRKIEMELGSAFGDQIKMVGPDRAEENVLENIRAYSVDEIQKNIGKTGADFGFNPEVTKEAQGAATNKRILETELPKILAEVAARESGGFNPEGSASQIIRKQLGSVLEGRVADPSDVLDKLMGKITEKINSRQAPTVADLIETDGSLGEILSGDTKTLEIFGNLIKEVNDKIASLTAQFNRYSMALNQATELQIQRDNVGIEGENQLTQALGGNLSLSELNSAFENSISVLTSRIGADGRTVAGTGTLDPKQIQQRMLAKEAEATNIQKQLDKEKPPVDSARFKELNSALIRTTAEARNLQTAHQKLATDASRASNALAKINEIRQRNESRQSMFLEVLKNAANPEWQLEFANSVDAFQMVMNGQNVGPEGFEKAVQGLEYKMRANPADAQAIQEDFIQNASKMLGAGNPEMQKLLSELLKGMGVGANLPPEMQALVDEFYKYNQIQQDAIIQSADRIVSAGQLFFNSVQAAGNAWVATVGAAGQQAPVQVQPLVPVKKARGGAIYAQDGGHMVNFQPKGTDTVPAMLTPGEFVVNRAAASKNMGLLKAINSGASKGYSKGGVVYLVDGGVAGGGGYVPKDTTIYEDAQKLEEEIKAAFAAVDQEIAEIDTLINPLREQHLNIPDGIGNDPQRKALWEKLKPLYDAKDALGTQRNQISASFRPRMDKIKERTDLEKDRRIAGTGELNMSDKNDLNTSNIPGSGIGFKAMDFATGQMDLNKLTPEERKQHDEYIAEVEKREAARIQKAKDNVAAVDGPPAQPPVQPPAQPQAKPPDPRDLDTLLGAGAGGTVRGGAEQQPGKPSNGNKRPTMRQMPLDPVAERAGRAKAHKDEMSRRREAFLANNPAIAKREEAKQAKADQERADAIQWSEETGQFIPGDGGDKEILKAYRSNKREEIAANRREATYGTRDKISPEKAKEILDFKRGQALAKRFNWSVDSLNGRYDGGTELPREVMILNEKDKEALTNYQNIEIEKIANEIEEISQEEREKKSAANLAAREKEDADFKTGLDKASAERTAAFTAKQAQETETKAEAARKAKAEKDAAVIANKASLAKRIQERIASNNTAFEGRKKQREEEKLKKGQEAKELEERKIVAVEAAVQIDPVTQQVINADPEQINSRVAELQKKQQEKIDRMTKNNPTQVRQGAARDLQGKVSPDKILSDSDPGYAADKKELERLGIIKGGIDRATSKFAQTRAEENSSTQERYEELKEQADKNKLRAQDSQEYASLSIKRGVKPSEIAGGGAVAAERRMRDDSLGEETRIALEEKGKKRFLKEGDGVETALAVGVGAAKGALPTAVGLQAGLATTAATAPFLGPFAPLAGLAVGTVAGLASSFAQEKALDVAAPKLNEEMNRIAAANPTAAAIGGALPGMGVGVLQGGVRSFAGSLAQRGTGGLASAGLAGGIEAGATGTVDPINLGIAFGTGFAQPGVPTKGSAPRIPSRPPKAKNSIRYPEQVFDDAGDFRNVPKEPQQIAATEKAATEAKNLANEQARKRARNTPAARKEAEARVQQDKVRAAEIAAFKEAEIEDEIASRLLAEADSPVVPEAGRTAGATTDDVLTGARIDDASKGAAKGASTSSVKPKVPLIDDRPLVVKALDPNVRTADIVFSEPPVGSSQSPGTAKKTVQETTTSSTMQDAATEAAKRAAEAERNAKPKITDITTRGRKKRAEAATAARKEADDLAQKALDDRIQQAIEISNKTSGSSRQPLVPKAPKEAGRATLEMPQGITAQQLSDEALRLKMEGNSRVNVDTLSPPADEGVKAQASQPKPSVQAVQPKPAAQSTTPAKSSGSATMPRTPTRMLPPTPEAIAKAQSKLSSAKHVAARSGGHLKTGANVDALLAPDATTVDEIIARFGGANRLNEAQLEQLESLRRFETEDPSVIRIADMSARGWEQYAPPRSGAAGFWDWSRGNHPSSLAKAVNDPKDIGLGSAVREKIKKIDEMRNNKDVVQAQKELSLLEEKKLSAAEFSRGGVVYAAKGQLIPFTPKGTDTVPAMLTPGEFVINRSATQKHLPLLKAINNNEVPAYARGGQVQRFQHGGMADQSGGGGGGVSNIELDTSGLDAAFNSFATNVDSLKSVMDSFAGAAANISAGFSQLSQLESGANRIGTAAASISSAAQTFGSVIANFNTSISTMQSAFEKIPSSVDFRVSGSVPINITVDVNGGDGLQESLATFQDQIFTEVSNGIKNAMPGVNISFTRTT